MHPLFSPFVAGFWRLLDWQMTPQQRLAYLEELIALGVTTTDHADIYGEYQCEAAFGDALKLKPSIRDEIKIITKCGIKPAWQANGFAGKTNHYNTSKASIIESVHASLKHFGTDRLDAVLLHRPDYLMNADDVAEAFMALKKAGDVLHFGVSNFTVSQMALLQSRLPFELVTNQVEMSPLAMQALDDGTLDYAQEHRQTPMFWSPLAGGELFNAQTEQAKRVRSALESLKQELDLESIDQVVYAWLRQLPCAPAVVLGTGNIKRVEGALKALDVRMHPEQWYRVWQASKGHPVP